MVGEISIWVIALAAFVGAMSSALLGWAQQDPPQPFDMRKFSGSIIRALIAAVGIAAAFNYAEATTPLCYLIAFISGAGVDAGGSRIAGAITAAKK